MLSKGYANATKERSNNERREEQGRRTQSQELTYLGRMAHRLVPQSGIQQRQTASCSTMCVLDRMKLGSTRAHRSRTRIEQCFLTDD